MEMCAKYRPVFSLSPKKLGKYATAVATFPLPTGTKPVNIPPNQANPLQEKVIDQCVFVFSSHSFWTSSSLDVPAGVTQEEGHTEFLIHLLSAVRALIFIARRMQPFLSFVDHEVEFCVLKI